MAKDKTYIVSVSGRENLIYTKLRGREVFYTYVKAKSLKEAKDKVWEAFSNNPEWSYHPRRDWKIEAEDWTGLKEEYGIMGITFEHVGKYSRDQFYACRKLLEEA